MHYIRRCEFYVFVGVLAGGVAAHIMWIILAWARLGRLPW